MTNTGEDTVTEAAYESAWNDDTTDPDALRCDDDAQSDADAIAAAFDPDKSAAYVTSELIDAVGAAEQQVPTITVLTGLAEALELLGQMQAAHDRLGVLIGQTERDLDQLGAGNLKVLPSGATVKVEPGSLSYDWVPPRDVLKVLCHDLIPQDDDDPMPSVWQVLDRIEAAVPASVQWKAAGVRPYADPDELRASKRSRRRVRVTQHAIEEGGDR